MTLETELPEFCQPCLEIFKKWSVKTEENTIAINDSIRCPGCGSIHTVIQVEPYVHVHTQTILEHVNIMKESTK